VGPSPPELVDKMLDMAKVTQGLRIDLGWVTAAP